jgi:metal-responsive CopG/Arc/MetJ family transcriptional regulator
MQLQFRPTHAQLAVIDRLVTEHQANSRSERIAAAMEAFLPPLTPRR